MTKHFTSREFNHETARAKRESLDGPVFITDRGRPAHVLLSFDEYRRLTGKRPSLADLLDHPASAHIELELPERRTDPLRDPFAE